MPLADVIAEGERIIEESERRGIELRFLGGLGIYHSCPSASAPPFSRAYGDIDVIGHERQARGIHELFVALGYSPRSRFNALYGRRRLIFNDLVNMRRVDVFLDVFEMALKLDLSKRIELCRPSLPVADLLLTKAQIIRISEKDLLDIILIFHDHALGADPCRDIEEEYVVRLASREWPIYMALRMNLQRAIDLLPSIEIGEEKRREVELRARTLLRLVEESPKSVSWRLRAGIGERVKWYRDVEEDQEVGE